MVPFEWETPTKLIFGEGCLDRLGKEVARYGKRVLFVYGQGSIKKLGIYDRVLEQLRSASISVVEHGGVKSNPILSHAEEGARKSRESGVDVILAVGGGSVIDEAKGIAIGASNAEPLWDFYLRKLLPRQALPLIAVQTLPASSTELNFVSVLTNDRTGEKFSVRSPHIFPKVTFLDPTFTIHIPLRQTAYAVTDILSHLWEGYFTQTQDYPVQDGLVEALSRGVMAAMDTLSADPRNLEARSDIMWVGAWAWNGLFKTGVAGASIPNHMLEHPLSGLHDLPHGAGLSIIIPAWLRYKKTEAAPRISKFGQAILGLDSRTARDGDSVIEGLVTWYRKIGVPTTFREAGLTSVDVDKLTSQALELCRLWGIKGYAAEDIRRIYQLAAG